jgi:glutathione S-transferase
MSDAMVLSRYEVALRPEPLRWSVWLEDQKDRFWNGLAWFERRADQVLSASAAKVDVSQLALACSLGYVDFRFPELGWSTKAPLVAAWYQTVMTRPSLARTDPRVAK